MIEIKSPSDVQPTIQDFLFNRTAAIPDDVRERLKDFIRPGFNAIEACVYCTELIYARREELPVELLQIGAAAATICSTVPLNGMQERGAAIVYTINKMPGVVKVLPSKFAAPEPLPEFTKTE